MALPLDKLFLLIAVIALPNLFFRAEYNVPLMLFCFGVWSATKYRAITMYLILFSWFVDAFCICREINSIYNQSGKVSVFFILLIIIFVFKMIAMILLAIFDLDCRKVIHPEYMAENFMGMVKGVSND